AQARLPAALSRERPLGIRVRDLLRRLEYRVDGDAAGAWRHEHRLDGRRCRGRPRPEAPAPARIHRPAPPAHDHPHPNPPRRPSSPESWSSWGRRRFPASPPGCSYRKERKRMTKQRTGTRDEWLAARLERLEAEKELTRRSDELARRRQELPWVRIDEEYRFE